MRLNLKHLIGNALMAFSLFLLLFIYYPILQLYLFPKNPDSNIKRTDYYIEIPKINVLSHIVEDVDPFNESIYRRELEKGVAQARNSSLPNEGGTTYLFAHSSDLPWRITRYNVAFFRLPELKNGDLIEIGRKGKIYKYKVSDTKTVSPSDIKYINDFSSDQLILQTCVPIGTSFQRLLVFAKPI